MPTQKDFQNQYLKERAEEIISELPSFCTTYFNGRENRLSGNTTLSYVYELSVFFEYLVTNNGYFCEKGVKNITLNDIEKLHTTDIEEFLHWLRYHKDENGIIHTNKDSSISKYLSCLNAFWKYFYKRKLLPENPIDIIDRQKKEKKKIIRLTDDEEDKFLQTVAKGTGLTDRQQIFHEKNALRDYAICLLFLDTGLRISELTAINVQDINFENHSIGVYRKGGDYEEIFFSDDVEIALEDYLWIRENYHPIDEDALFLSSKGSRLGNRQIQKMVKKYTQASIPGKAEQITPHKLRATFATNMLKATGNIRLVQQQLGHKHIQTTTIYADIDEKERADVRNALQRNKQP